MTTRDDYRATMVGDQLQAALTAIGDDVVGFVVVITAGAGDVVIEGRSRIPKRDFWNLLRRSAITRTGTPPDEVEARELHHFETEQAMTHALALLDGGDVDAARAVLRGAL